MPYMDPMGKTRPVCLGKISFMVKRVNFRTSFSLVFGGLETPRISTEQRQSWTKDEGEIGLGVFVVGLISENRGKRWGWKQPNSQNIQEVIRLIRLTFF